MSHIEGLQKIEGVKRAVPVALLSVFCSFLVVPTSRADVCMSPRIRRAAACGEVIDPYGMKIPGATIEFTVNGSKSSVLTDTHGRFSLALQGDEVHLQVDAPAFQSVETTIGRLKEPPAHCKKPMFVMLTIGEQGCAMISLRKSELLLAKKD